MTTEQYGQVVADAIEALIRAVVLDMHHDDVGYAIDVMDANKLLAGVLNGSR